MSDDRDMQRSVQEAVNHLGGLLSRIRLLETALRESRNTIQTLRKGIASASFHVPYSSSTPKSFDVIAIEAIAEINKKIGE